VEYAIVSSKGFVRDDVTGQRIQPLSLRPREAAQALGISVSTLERLTRSGDIPSVKLNRVVLYTVATLKAWLAAKQTSTTNTISDPRAPSPSNQDAS
jgi:excisionase family DNA binding protein